MMSLITHLGGLCREGRLKDALHILLTTNNICVESSIYLHLLQVCIDKKALLSNPFSHQGQGTYICQKHIFTICDNQFINMYDKCGS